MTPNDLKDAIHMELASLWPDRTIYPDACPDDHTRPSAFIQVLEAVPARANIGLVRWSFKGLIVLWGEMDAYTLTDADGLMGDQADVIAVLTRMALAVGDRHVLLEAKGKGQDPADGAAFVEVTASWIDKLPAPHNSEPQEPDGPMMEDFIGQINNNEVEVRSDKNG